MSGNASRIREQQKAWARRFDVPGPGEPRWTSTWSEWTDYLNGEDVVVVGTGPSFCRNIETHPKTGLKVFRAHNLSNHFTIACNRAVNRITPTFALCFEPYMDRDCWDAIRAACPQFVITGDQVEIHRRMIQFPEWPGSILANLPQIGCSGYYAAIVATVLGARNIGLLGSADFIGHPKLGTPKSLATLREGFVELQKIMEARGGTFLQLGKSDALMGVVPYGELGDIQPRFRPPIAEEHGKPIFGR